MEETEEKKDEEYASSIKDYWHPYGLQGLSPDKFAAVATKILEKSHRLLPLKWPRIK